MSAHHAPRHVVRTASALRNLVGVSGLVTVFGYGLGIIAFGASDRDDPLNVFLWGSSGASIYSPPLGELLVGGLLLILGSIMLKVSPRFRRADHGIPTLGPRWKIGPKIKAVKDSLAYPQRRIGRRMIGLGIPSALLGLLMIWVYATASGTVRDGGLDLRLGATIGLIAGAVGAVVAMLAVVIGVVFLAGAPSADAVKRAEAAGRVAPPPPASGRGSLPAPPAPPAPA